MRILQGRGFEEADRNGAPVIVVNEAFARLGWQERSPIGECVYREQESVCANVVGVAANARRFNILEDAPHPYFFMIAAIASRFIGELLFKVSPRDPPVFGVIAAGVLILSAAASVLPAWHAFRTDPVDSLRAE